MQSVSRELGDGDVASCASAKRQSYSKLVNEAMDNSFDSSAAEESCSEHQGEALGLWRERGATWRVLRASTTVAVTFSGAAAAAGIAWRTATVRPQAAGGARHGSTSGVTVLQQVWGSQGSDPYAQQQWAAPAADFYSQQGYALGQQQDSATTYPYQTDFSGQGGYADAWPQQAAAGPYGPSPAPTWAPTGNGRYSPSPAPTWAPTGNATSQASARDDAPYEGYEEDLKKYNDLFNQDAEAQPSTTTSKYGGAHEGYEFANPAPTPGAPPPAASPLPTPQWWSAGTSGSSTTDQQTAGPWLVGAPTAAPLPPTQAPLTTPSPTAPSPTAPSPTAPSPTAPSQTAPSPTAPPATSTSTTRRISTTPPATTTSTTVTTVTTTTGPLRSLYCFALMMPSGDELTLMKELLARGQGIFMCDSYSLFSSEDVELSPGPPRVGTESIGSVHCEYGGEFNLALNSEIFVRVWKKVFSDGLFDQHGWTVKVDPDAVFFPDRLQWQVRSSNSSESVYLNNCDQGLHGPIEIISRGGMRDFKSGVDDCVAALQYEFSSQGEDVFLRHCLGMLKVNRVDNFAVLDEQACMYGDPVQRGCYSGKVSFHPFKKVDTYFKCVEQALSSPGGDDSEEPHGDESDEDNPH